MYVKSGEKIMIEAYKKKEISNGDKGVLSKKKNILINKIHLLVKDGKPSEVDNKLTKISEILSG